MPDGAIAAVRRRRHRLRFWLWRRGTVGVRIEMLTQKGWEKPGPLLLRIGDQIDVSDGDGALVARIMLERPERT